MAEHERLCLIGPEDDLRGPDRVDRQKQSLFAAAFERVLPSHEPSRRIVDVIPDAARPSPHPVRDIDLWLCLVGLRLVCVDSREADVLPALHRALDPERFRRLYIARGELKESDASHDAEIKLERDDAAGATIWSTRIPGGGVDWFGEYVLTVVHVRKRSLECVAVMLYLDGGNMTWAEELRRALLHELTRS